MTLCGIERVDEVSADRPLRGWRQIWSREGAVDHIHITYADTWDTASARARNCLSLCEEGWSVVVDSKPIEEKQ